MDYKVGDTVRHIDDKEFVGIIQYERIKIKRDLEDGKPIPLYKCYYTTFMLGWIDKQNKKDRRIMHGDLMSFSMIGVSGRSFSNTFFRSPHLISAKILLTERRVPSINHVPISFGSKESWNNPNLNSTIYEF